MKAPIVLAALLISLAAVDLACASRQPSFMPPRVSGQLPADFQLSAARGVVVARVSIVTDGTKEFAAVGDRLVLQFQPGDAPDGAARTVTMMDRNAFVLTPSVPSVWPYEPPGLLAMSIAPGIYDGLAVAYPDFGHHVTTPDSVPVPSQSFVFAPLQISAGAIVYVGDIEIQQRYDFLDLVLDRIQVGYAVHDNYEGTVAEFRARYPQLAEVPVQRRVAQAVSAAE